MKAFFGKFSSISRDLEIFTVPRIVGRVKRSLMVFIPKAFRAKSVHNLIGDDIPVVTEKIFYILPGSRPAIFYSCI